MKKRSLFAEIADGFRALAAMRKPLVSWDEGDVDLDDDEAWERAKAHFPPQDGYVADESI